MSNLLKEAIANRWNDADTATMSEPDLLLYRSNLLGSDLRITNYGGGNTSAKIRLRDPLGFEVALRPAAGETASGRAVLASADAGITMQLWVRGLPRDPGIVYEVMCDAPGWSASAGTFRVDSHGRAHVVLNTAARRGEYDAIRVVRRSRSSETDVLQATL